MLIEFQRALADLTSNPELVNQIRINPSRIHDLYRLNELEHRQLVAVVQSPGMRANCILYRANRLAPIAINLPETCRLLGDRLEELVSEYWKSQPITNVHFLLETQAFCDFLQMRELPHPARQKLQEESSIVKAKIVYSRTARF